MQKIKLILLTIVVSTTLNANNFFYEYDKKIELQPKINPNNITNIDSNYIHEYTTVDGKNIKFRNQLIVECKEGSYCEDDFFDLSLDNYEKIAPNIYLINLSNSNDIFEISQKLHEKVDIKTAQPNYIRKVIKR